MRAPTPDHKPVMPTTPAPPASGAVRLPRWVFPLVTIVSLLLGATSIVRGTRAIVTIEDSDLTSFFLRSADYILRGDPWHMYAVRAVGAYPNYNPPLSMFLLAPLLGLARAFGFAANYGEQITFVTLPFILLVPLMGYLGLHVMRRLYPDAPETLRLLLYCFITLSPLTWQSYSIWYHVEQPLMLCFLLAAVLALQARREGLAGALAGLAFLSRTTALIPLIALGVLLLMSRKWAPLLKFGGVSAVVAGLGFAPFALFDLADVKYTFLSWRGGAPIGSDSIWTIFAYTGTSSHLRSLINAAAKRLDMYTVMLVVLVVAVLAARRLRLTVVDRDVWALVALAALATPMLSKQVWPYYYLEPMIFIVVWELSTLQDRVAGVWRWPVLSISFTLVAASLSQYIGLKSVGRLDALTLGVTQTALMAMFALGVWARIQARKPVTPASGALASPDVAQAGMQPMTPPGMAVAGAAMGGGRAPRQAAPIGGQAPARPPSAPQPLPQTPGSGPLPPGGWQAPQPGQAQAPARYGANAQPAPPAFPNAGATPLRGQAAAPGPANQPNPMNPMNPMNPGRPAGGGRHVGQLWPSEGAAGRGAPPAPPAQAATQNPQEWRGPSAPAPQAAQPQGAQPQAPRAPGAPAQDAEQPPSGVVDPWRDWPQQR